MFHFDLDLPTTTTDPGCARLQLAEAFRRNQKLPIDRFDVITGDEDEYAVVLDVSLKPQEQ